MAISGGIIGTAKSWSTPVVESVILPAHAQSSVFLRDPCEVEIRPGGEPNVFSVRVRGTVTDQSNNGVPGITVNISATNGFDEWSANDITDADGNYAETLGPFDANDGPGAATVTATVTSAAFSETAQCSATKNLPA